MLVCKTTNASASARRLAFVATNPGLVATGASAGELGTNTGAGAVMAGVAGERATWLIPSKLTKTTNAAMETSGLITHSFDGSWNLPCLEDTLKFHYLKQSPAGGFLYGVLSQSAWTSPPAAEFLCGPPSGMIRFNVLTFPRINRLPSGFRRDGMRAEISADLPAQATHRRLAFGRR